MSYDAPQPLMPEITGERVSQEEKLFAVFGSLWAIAILFHIAAFDTIDNSLGDFLLGLAAIFFLTKPSSAGRLLLLAGFQVYIVAESMPFVPNHWIFMAFVNLTILHAYGWQLIRTGNRVTTSALYNTFAPLIRVELLIFYFYVVLHKLNTDFLAMDVSCATTFYTEQNSRAWLPNSPFFLRSSIYGTLLVEAAIPVLLFFRRTRYAGVVLGAVFHSIIAFNPLQPFYDFSSFIFAIYFLFLAPDHLTVFHRLWLSSRLRQQVYHLRKMPYSPAWLAIGGGLLLTGFLLLHVISEHTQDFIRYVVWGLYSIVYIGVVVSVWLVSRSSLSFYKPLFRVPHVVLWLMPVVVLLNGACPYLGLKTESSFAMFSNLRTEGNQTNHLFIPVSTQLFGFQKDMVEIIHASDPRIQRLADQQKLITFFELRRHVSSSSPFAVSYIRNGRRVDVENTAASAEFARPLPLVWRGLFYFRTIYKDGAQPCSH